MSKANRQNFYLYNFSLKQLAIENRKTSTKAEACLWKYVLRAGKMKGYHFLRQRPILNYIVDFMCKELKLIIEVDGISHSYEQTSEKDSIRQKEIEKAGFKILRYTDEEVLMAINGVQADIENYIAGLKKQ
jgi:very-short-patch-repair endonuclease